MTRNDPKTVLRALLAAEWDASNTHGITPDLRTGWRDSDLAAPQVTLGPDDESALSDTGFTGISPDGSGPTSDRRGTVQVNAWATRSVLDGVNPKSAVDAFVDEAARIVRDHYLVAEHESVAAPEYKYIAWLGREFMPEPPGDPEAETMFRYRGEVRYEYRDRR